MKFLIDQNLSFKLADALQERYPGTRHVASLEMTTASDDAVWESAKTGSFTILSKDSDFMHRSLLHGHPPKVVQLLCGNCSTAKIVAILLRDQSVLDGFIQDPTESLLILK